MRSGLEFWTVAVPTSVKRRVETLARGDYAANMGSGTPPNHYRGGGSYSPASIADAATDADVIYTDVWTSMGQEAETQARLAAFADFQINRQLVSKAHKNSIILHCLPAHRGEEITEEVLDGPASRIIPQAANRMHFQKALIVWLITGWKTI